MFFSKVLHTVWWKSVIPKGWRAALDHVARFEPRHTKDSALQIGCDRRSRGVVHDEELQSNLATLCPTPRKTPEAISLGHLQGYTGELVLARDRTYWRYWMLKNGPLLFTVTYNCDAHLEGRDAAVCEQVLKSIVLRQP
jgi:hypothetical protein